MLPSIDIEGTLRLPENGRAILQTLFPAHQRVIVKREFTGNLSGSRVFLVQPITAQGTEYPVVVKFAALSLIEKEWRAYQRIRQTLYGVVRVQNKVLPSDGEWAALSYPLQGGGMFEVDNLYDYCQHCHAREILQTFYRVFKTLEGIHNQSRAVSGFFWRASYDHILPVNLLMASADLPADVPVQILDVSNVEVGNVQLGDWVELRGFTVTKVDLRDHTVTLNLPYKTEHSDSFCVRVMVTESPAIYHEHQIVPSFTGQVMATRPSQLQTYAQSLLAAEAAATAPSFSADGVSLPNPFLRVATILNQYRDVRTALIHGDLNLYNVLVDVDTGYISLIDVTEAHEDHILHDFLRMETEVVTKLLPDLLSAVALSVPRTMFEFYQALHCATFESPTLHDYRLPLDLEKPFEAIRSIRRMAARHFYSDDPSEYYQGLLLYLVGALKFSNLDRHPTAPLPKQAALWGAATVAWLLDSAPVCQPHSMPMLEAAPPAALLIDYTPEVKVLRKDTECFVPAYGMPLYQGDVVSTFTAAHALIYCRNGSLLAVPDEHNQCIDASHIPSERVWAHLERYDITYWPFLINHVSFNLTLPPETVSPLLLAPRQTRLQATRPTFYWRAVVGATAYRLSLRMPNGIIWQRETPFTTLLYPDDAPALTPGSGNTVVLEVVHAPSPSETVYLEMLREEELAMVQTQEGIIRELHPNAVAECYLLALLYRRWGLWGAAIHQLEQLACGMPSLSSAFWLLLGELYLRIGLYAQSEEQYLQALSYGKIEQNMTAQTLAYMGLVCASGAQSHYLQAQNYLEAANLQEDKALLQFVHDQLEPVPRRAYSVVTTPVGLFDYVRSLAEQIAVHLTDEIRHIPERFLEQLQTMSPYTLRPTADGWSTLGSDKLAAMEMLAMTYITTRTLLEAFPRAEFERQIQTGQIEQLLRDHAQQIVQTTLGVSVEKAADFANRYTAMVRDHLDILRQLLDSQEL